MAKSAVSVSDPILLQWYTLAVLIGLSEHLASHWGWEMRANLAEFLREPTEESWKISASKIARQDDPEWPSTLVIYPEEASVWAPDPNGRLIIDGSCLETSGISIIYAFVMDK